MYTGRKKHKMQGKKASHTDAITKTLVIELIRNGRLKTTVAKSKILKATFDRLVTLEKKNTPGAKNKIVSFFGNAARGVTRLNFVVSKYLSDRTSGYTYSVKTLPRKGDNADMAIVEIINFEMKVKKSKIQKAKEKEEKQEEKKKSGGIIARATRAAGARANVEKKTERRRNSK